MAQMCFGLRSKTKDPWNYWLEQILHFDLSQKAEKRELLLFLFKIPFDFVEWLNNNNK